MTIHELKTHWRYFNETWKGNKTFEVRKNDRSFRKQDLLLLREINPERAKLYTNRAILCGINYILTIPDFVKKGFAILSIEILKKYEYYDR